MVGTKKLLFTFVCLVVASQLMAAYSLTSQSVDVQDLTIDKTNYFITVVAQTSDGKSEYEVAFDVWPKTKSLKGSFSREDKTISYVNSFVHKTKADGKSANLWYECQETSTITLTISAVNDSVLSLSGTIQATRNSTAYTYNLSEINFVWRDTVGPDPTLDPYRFEPEKDTSFLFYADVVSFREKEGYINITLNEMADSTYSWVDLNLLTDTLAWPAGDYQIDSTGNKWSLTASRGYLGQQNDDPSFVAMRIEDEWGQYTPYYLIGGTVHVAYNTKGDTIYVTGEVQSKHGSVITLDVKSYNMLYVPGEEPKEPEFVTLQIDTVAISYLREEADTLAGKFPYTFVFSQSDNFPQVMMDVLLPSPMELTAGTYTLAQKKLSGILLFQDQGDFNNYFFSGETYVWKTVTMTLAAVEDEKWQFDMKLVDTIGSEYTFTLVQKPHIINYPEPEIPAAYKDESQIPEVVNLTLDSMLWVDSTVTKDGILDIWLMQKEMDKEGLRYVVQLSMFTSTSEVAAGSYPINESEQNGTFSASMGKIGNVVIPCAVAQVDSTGAVYNIWYLMSGDIAISYNAFGRVISGECTSYFGSTIRFSYSAPTPSGLRDAAESSARVSKCIRDGQLLMEYNGQTYSILGNIMK